MLKPKLSKSGPFDEAKKDFALSFDREFFKFFDSQFTSFYKETYDFVYQAQSLRFFSVRVYWVKFFELQISLF